MFNQVILIGNVGRDPKIHGSDIGEFATFSLATSDKWKDKNGQPKEVTQWHNISVFSTHSVNYIKNYVKKGSRLQVIGQVTYRKANDVTYTDIKVDNFSGKIIGLSEKPITNYGSEKTGNGYIANPQSQTTSQQKDIDDEIPF